MTTAFARTDPSILARWWWTVDRWILAAVLMLMACGALLVMAASPAVAERLRLDSFYFAQRQFTLLIPALIVMLSVSTLAPRGIRRLAVFLFLAAMLALIAVPIVGVEIKGARRWLHLGGLSVQPSEFVKPALAVLTAWMFSLQRTQEGFPGNAVAFALFLSVAMLLVAQPDIGMVALVTAMWMAQFFVAGLPWRWVILSALAAVTALTLGYFMLDHVKSRVDRFIDPASGDSYQITQSLEAFANGGLLGRGPGEGRVKEALPDAHADFIFAVAGEEFGLFLCLGIVALFAFIILRGLGRALGENNLFVMLAITGLVVQLGLQAAINMGSSLDLMPTKGMTLPFISYGGSSLLALALGMGMLLALTRKRPGMEAE